MRLKKSYTTFIMEFKSYISSVLDLDGLSSDEVASLLQDVADPRMGDVALPCFKLAARLKKPPQAIAAQTDMSFFIADLLFSCTDPVYRKAKALSRQKSAGN